MDSIDAYGETSRLILEGSSSRLSKSTNNSTSNKRLGYLPSNDSMDSYEYQETNSILNMSSSSSNDSISSNGLGYLPSNESMDATSILERSKSTSTTNTPFGFSTSEPPSPYFMSLIEAKADQIIATSTSNVIP
uniref:Uncharacterized protein n=1 Tax=Solanum lycopersicum TaxID=4081 RepID=A0A3Q7JG09_SOLLC